MASNPDPMTPDGDVNPISTDYRIGQDNVVVKLGPLGLEIRNRVFAWLHGPGAGRLAPRSADGTGQALGQASPAGPAPAAAPAPRS